jgi:hypothetical protein
MIEGLVHRVQGIRPLSCRGTRTLCVLSSKFLTRSFA